jgi:hypothetical protein
VPRRLALVFALLCALSGAAVLAGAATAASAPPHSCLVTGGIRGPNPAQVGDTVGAYVNVFNTRGGCNASWVEISANDRVYCSATLTSGQGGCEASFRAYDGLSTVSALLDVTSYDRTLGTFTVVGSTPPPTSITTVHVTVPPPTTVRVTVARSAASSAATSTTALARPAGAFPTAPPGAFDDADTASNSASPTASASPTNELDAPAVPVAVIHGSGSVSVIPVSLLAVALIVLAGVFGAAARYVYQHNRPPD